MLQEACPLESIQLTFTVVMQLPTSSPFRTYLNLSKKSHVCPISCSPPSSLTLPIPTHSGLYTSRWMCQVTHMRKGCSLSEKHPQQAASPGYRKNWPFQLFPSGLVVLPQQLVLNSIQVPQMTLRKGCKLPREEWTHFKGSRLWEGLEN